MRSLFAILCLALLIGCGTSRDGDRKEQREDHQVERTTTVEETTEATPAGPVVTKSVRTVVDRELVASGSTTEATHQVMTVQAPAVVGTLTAIAAGAGAANPWAVAGLGLLTTAVGAFGAHQRAVAQEQRRSSDFHEADAKEAWEALKAKALASGPPAPANDLTGA